MKFRFHARFAAPSWLGAVLLLAFIGGIALAKPPKIRDIADTVAANPILTNFAAMVQASDLGTFLSSRGPFTVFVPTDSAFAKLPPGMLATLLRPENKERLQDIVLFHVVNGKRLTAKDILPLTSELSCQGNPLTFKTNRLGVQMVLKAKIIHADIRCANGIINEIDTLLMPPDSALPPLKQPSPPATNAPTGSAPADTNAAPVNTNSAPEAPAAPGGVPEVSPH